MKSIFNQWKTRNPKYNEIYKPLFEFFARKGDESKREDLKDLHGKTFSKQYEFYIYAFFYGLYQNEKVYLEKEDVKATFGQPIQYWGNVHTIDRKQFSDIQYYIFTALIAESDLDLLELENADEQKVEIAVKSLIKDMEAYANGGFILIQEKFIEDKAFFYNKEVFVDMVLPS